MVKSSPQAKAFATVVVIGAITTFSLLYYAETVQFTTWKLGWAPSPCNAGASATAASKGFKAFAMHVFFMGLAFGLFAPIGAVTFVLIRDTIGLSQNVAKAVHGIVALGAFLCSVLGYTQMYYAHGADGCAGKSVHYQSVHSYVGIVVLVLFWLQLPSALTLLSNTKLLPPGGFGRRTFLKYHIFVGTFGVFAGLATVITGILVLVAKSTTTMPTPEYWWLYARAATSAFVTLFFLALALFESKAAPLSTKGTATAPEDDNTLLVEMSMG
jgi:ABC-type transport system involved in cytochrome c biogenesis permease component